MDSTEQNTSDETYQPWSSADPWIELYHRDHGTTELSEPLLLANSNEQGYPLPISIHDPGFDWSTLPQAVNGKSQ